MADLDDIELPTPPATPLRKNAGKCGGWAKGTSQYRIDGKWFWQCPACAYTLEYEVNDDDPEVRRVFMMKRTNHWYNHHRHQTRVDGRSTMMPRPVLRRLTAAQQATATWKCPLCPMGFTKEDGDKYTQNRMRPVRMQHGVEAHADHTRREYGELVRLQGLRAPATRTRMGAMMHNTITMHFLHALRRGPTQHSFQLLDIPKWISRLDNYRTGKFALCSGCGKLLRANHAIKVLTTPCDKWTVTKTRTKMVARLRACQEEVRNDPRFSHLEPRFATAIQALEAAAARATTSSSTETAPRGHQ